MITQKYDLVRPLPKEVDQSDLLHFGYQYTSSGHLVDKKGQPFRWNIDMYEQLCDSMISFVQLVMVQQYDMHEVWLPLPENLKNDPSIHSVGKTFTSPSTRINSSNIFVSKDWNKKQVLCLIIQGSNKRSKQRRPGVWSRSSCINNGLGAGSMFNYLHHLDERDIGCMVLNPNLNEVDGMKVPGNSTGLEHCAYVYEKFLTRTNQDIIFIANQEGGERVFDLICQNPKLVKRVRCIALTDSTHSFEKYGENKDYEPRTSKHDVTELYKRCAQPWMCPWFNPHKSPLNSPIQGSSIRSRPRASLSSGVSDRTFTSACVESSVFNFIDETLETKLIKKRSYDAIRATTLNAQKLANHDPLNKTPSPKPYHSQLNSYPSFGSMVSQGENSKENYAIFKS